MLGRVTPGYIKNDFLYNIKESNANLQKKSTALSSGMRINLPSDDTGNLINYMKWESKQQDIGKFNQIIDSQKNKINIIDGNLGSIGDSLQRARELVVQGANGTYTKEDRVAIATEIDQIIRQLVADANSEYKGNPIFGGTSTRTQPYRLQENIDPDMNVPFVDSVQYFGNGQEQVMDIGKKDRIVSVLPGSSIFETNKTIIQGSSDVSGYVTSRDANIMIEGVEIPILTGDNLEAIAQKINAANVSVNASIETTADGTAHFRVTSIAARQPWLQDIDGSTVLQDLGIIDGGTEGPRNYAPTAVVQKTSIFDTLIQVRDNLIDNDILSLGGELLGQVDKSLNNVLRYRSYTGAVSERLDSTYNRNATESLYLKDSAANAVNTDFAKTVTEMKMAEFAHQTALNIGAKLMPTTLMDFLR